MYYNLQSIYFSNISIKNFQQKKYLNVAKINRLQTLTLNNLVS